MHKRLSTLGVALVLAVFAATFGLAGLGAGPASVRASTTLEACGKVTVYVHPTANVAGQITVGGDPFVIAAGADVDPDVDADADLCLRLTLNASGEVTNLVVVEADAAARVRICGVVSAYVEASGSHTGELTIGKRTLTIAAGVDLPASIKIGSDLCATFTLNAQGNVEDANVRAHADSTLHLCGTVDALVDATADSTGKLTIGNHALTLAAGADVPGKVSVGADICADLELNVDGQIVDVVVTNGPGPSDEPGGGGNGGGDGDGNGGDAQPTPPPEAGTGDTDGTGGPGDQCPTGVDLLASTVLSPDASLGRYPSGPSSVAGRPRSAISERTRSGSSW